MNSMELQSQKDKVVFVMGATGTGKTKLAIDLALHFDGEIINSDKIQVYDGLEVIANKVTEAERKGVPHHLLGGVHPNADFSTSDFCMQATRAANSITAKGKLPIIAGGSNSYLEALVDVRGGKFQERFECCFIWVDVELPVLHTFVEERVDVMVERGLVEEARRLFDPEADYTKGLRRAIGVPEMDNYFREEPKLDDAMRKQMLAEAISKVKKNTCELTRHQLHKIQRLRTELGWDIHRVDATKVHMMRGTEGYAQAWEEIVRCPSIEIVTSFLNNNAGVAASSNAN